MTTLPPPISTFSDIDGGRCEYIEAHQAHEHHPRTPAAMRLVCSASAACASSRYSRCGMTLRAPVAFSFRHPALSLWRCYARRFAAPRAGVSGSSPATRRVGLAQTDAPPLFSLPCTPSSCATSALLAHHRHSVISSCSRPLAALPLSGSCARCAAGRAITHAPCVALATLGRAVSAYGRIFCRLALCVAGRFSHGFPMSSARHSLPMLQASRMLVGGCPFGGGSCRPHPPLLLQSGALPP